MDLLSLSLMYVKKFASFCQVLKKDARKRKLVPFFLRHGVDRQRVYKGGLRRTTQGRGPRSRRLDRQCSDCHRLAQRHSQVHVLQRHRRHLSRSYPVSWHCPRSIVGGVA